MMNPFNQNFGHIQAVKSLLRSVDDSAIVSMVSFTRRCTFKVDIELRKIQSNDLIVYDTELSEFITRKMNILRLQMNTPVFTDDTILQMYRVLNESNILDKQIREKHIESINTKVKLEEPEVGPAHVATCKACGKEVSEKVKSFCLSNQNRFKGNIYCFEHQK